MIKKLFTAAALLAVVWLPAQAYEKRNLLENAATEAQVRQYLVTDRKWVPYPAYDDRAGWDQLIGDSKEDIIKAGQQYLDYHWTVVRATDYLEYEKSGNRNTMQNPNNQNARVFSILLMAELAEGKGRFVNDLMNGVLFFSEMTSWAESAHLAVFQKTRRAMPDFREDVLELHQGGMAQMLSWTYYFLKDSFDKIDPMIALRLRHELQKRELDPFMQRDDFWWMGRNYKEGALLNNWTPWCNANALLCFMLLEDNPDTLAKAVYKSMESVDKFLNYVKSDGACEEGPSYWGHASGKLYDYLSELSLITGGKINLFGNEQIRKMGEYIARSYIGDEWVANFADASARAGEVNTSLIYRYGVAVNSKMMKSMAAMREKLYPSKLPSSWMDLYIGLETLRFRPLLNKEKSEFKYPDFTWYPQTEFCYMRSGGAFLAAKGGFNNESHNHNDVGTFILAFDNVPVMIDAGVGTYTRKTFSKERYTIWTMQSDYHNLPMINGVSEQFGAQYKARNVKADAKSLSFSADIAGAYPTEAAVEHWTRSYQLKKNRLLISDNFILKEAKAPNKVNFLTWGNVDISKKGLVVINVKGITAVLSYDAATFEPSIEKVSLTDPRLSKVWGSEIYRITLTARTTALKGIYNYVIVKKTK